jgi:G-protein signaling modulator 2
MICEKLENYEQATKHYEAALEIARNDKDTKNEGSLLGNIGNLHYLVGNYSDALKNLSEALTIAKNIMLKRLEANLLNTMAVIHYRLAQQEHEKAATLAHQAVKISKEAETKDREVMQTTTLAAALIKLEKYDEALELLHHVRVIAVDNDYYKLLKEIDRGIVDALIGQLATQIDAIKNDKQL